MKCVHDIEREHCEQCSRTPLRRCGPESVPQNQYHAVWHALDSVLTAWDALEGGRGHSAIAVERWLNKVMGPAIVEARKVMGRKEKA